MSAAVPALSGALGRRVWRLGAISAAIALGGAGIASYLTVVHDLGGTPVCAIAHGCAAVQQSAYAAVAGVPVALLGLIGYVAILVSLTRDGQAWRTATAFLAGEPRLLGLAAWVEVGVLAAICAWCVGSALCMTALACVSVVRQLGAPAEG